MCMALAAMTKNTWLTNAMLAFGNMLQQKKCMHCSEFSIERVDAKLIPLVACLTLHLHTLPKQ